MWQWHIQESTYEVISCNFFPLKNSISELLSGKYFIILTDNNNNNKKKPPKNPIQHLKDNAYF